MPNWIEYDRSEDGYFECAFEAPLWDEDDEDGDLPDTVRADLVKAYGEDAKIDTRDNYTVWIWS